MNRQIITAIVFMLIATGGCAPSDMTVGQRPAAPDAASLADHYADPAARIIASALAGNDAYLKMQ